MNLNEEQPISLHFRTPWHAKNEFDPQETDIECSFLKPPHYLQDGPKNSLNMESVGSMQNTQLFTKSHVELEEILLSSP